MIKKPIAFQLLADTNKRFYISGVVYNGDMERNVIFWMETDKAFTVNRTELSHFRGIKIGKNGDVMEKGWHIYQQVFLSFEIISFATPNNFIGHSFFLLKKHKDFVLLKNLNTFANIV